MLKQSLKSIKIMFKFAMVPTIVKLFELLITALMVPLAITFTKNLIDSIAPYIDGETVVNPVIVWTGLLLLSMLFSANITFFNSIQYVNMQKSINEKLTKNILKKFMTIKYEHFEDSDVNDTLKRMGENPQEKIFNIFLNTTGVLSKLISIVGLAFVFSQISIWLTLGFVVLFIIIMLATFRSMDIINSLYTQQTQDERRFHYYGQLISDKHSLYELRVFGAVDYIKNLWKSKTEIVLKQRVKKTIISQKYYVVVAFGIVGFIGLIIYYLITSLEASAITLGMFTAIIGASISVLDLTNELAHSFANLSKRYLEIKHYDTFMNLSEVNSTDEGLVNDNSTIVFDDVHFTYPKTKVPILKGVSFRIEKNEKIALVGKNGAGKSTIVKLLCGLYAAQEGKICIGDTDINKVGKKTISSFISVVFQDFGKYWLSVRENIALGNISKLNDDAAITKAMKQGLADNINLRLDTQLGKLDDEGIDLSGGQWQRLAIARACIADSKFIVLDEPTAALDPVAESYMYHAFNKVLKNRGAIMISHRLASARMCDRILVIDEGRIIENGTHDQLMSTGGLYAQMFIAQSSWYREAKNEEEI